MVFFNNIFCITHVMWISINVSKRYCKISNVASINKHVYLLGFNNYTSFTYLIYIQSKSEEENCNVRSKSQVQCSLLQVIMKRNTS